MLNNPYSVVTIPTQLLADILQMARKSPQYRKGFAWTASAMHTANKLLLCQQYREGTASETDVLYLELTTQSNLKRGG